MNIHKWIFFSFLLMNPSRLSSSLRRIAAAIDNSKNPSRELVARELKSLVTHLASDERINYYKGLQRMLQRMHNAIDMDKKKESLELFYGGLGHFVALTNDSDLIASQRKIGESLKKSFNGPKYDSSLYESMEAAIKKIYDNYLGIARSL